MVWYISLFTTMGICPIHSSLHPSPLYGDGLMMMSTKEYHFTSTRPTAAIAAYGHPRLYFPSSTYSFYNKQTNQKHKTQAALLSFSSLLGPTSVRMLLLFLLFDQLTHETKSA